MASTSTSSCIRKSYKYDVFLSFRGEDTRKNFVDHLYYALKQRNIHTYKDDETINKGKRINDELIGSIEDSKFYVIVFSKNYASSSWCLDELAKIIECQKTTSDHTAYPVFYDVEPTEIRKQSGAVGEAFAKHEHNESAGKWKEALKEAADLAGWELKNTDDGHEAKFIQKIVQEISLELRSINSSVDEKLIGMETRVNDVVSSLESGNDGVLMIGIKGMGGGGKTTLARAVFDEISVQFEGKSFVENVREVSNASFYGLNKLQEQVLSNVLNDQSIRVSSVHDGRHMMKKMMRGRKVLVVLDDVDHLDQLEALAGETSWFRPGSRIIITTRDEQVLLAHKVNSIHDVTLLSDNEAVCLFSRYAFGRETPFQGYGELSGQVVRYAAGLPLTIKVLGSSLCGKNDLEWTDAIERLKTIPLKETLEKLELSYIGLEKDHKEIFLDVSCFMIGWEKDRAIRVLESCGFHARNGLRVLEQKSLITFYDGIGDEYLSMHDHISEMGRNIVRRLHPDEPNRHIRLWNDEEIKDILVNDKGTKATRCIRLCGGKFDPEIIMKGLGNMKQLIFLDVHEGQNPFDFFLGSRKQFNGSFSGSSWHFDEVSQYLPNALRFLNWNDYPFRCLPKTFLANNLVRLEMHSNRLEQLWERGERKVLNKLRFVDLRYSKFLKTLDLSLTPNLEMLNLQQCEDLVQLHNPNGLPKLKSLVLDYSKLRYLNLGPTPDLESLSLEGCCDLVELHIPFRCPKLKSLNLNWSKLRTLNLGQISDLEIVSLKGGDLVELHMPNECPKLKSLILDKSKLRCLKLGLTPGLETLSLEGCCDLVELHIPFRCPKLKSLNLNRSKLRTLDLGMISDLETLSLRKGDLVELDMPFRCPDLKSLSLIDLKLRYLNLGMTPNLETLNLEQCCDLEELHMPLGCPNLKYLKIRNSKLRTLDLGLTPNVERLDLQKCHDLEEVHAPIGFMKKILYLNLRGCRRFDSFVFKSYVESHEVSSLSELHLIAESLDTCPSHPDNDFFPKFRVKCFYKEQPPSSSRNLEKLVSLGLCVSTNPESSGSFSVSICSLRFIKRFLIEGIIPEVPTEDLNQLQGLTDSICMQQYLSSLKLKYWHLEKLPENFLQLESLEELTLSSSKIKNLPDTICMLKHLKTLELKSCWHFEKLPRDLGRLQCLEKLILSECIVLRDIPNSICEIKNLKYIHLPYCLLLEKLPDELGRLKCPEELNIEGTGISHLPQSIFLLQGLCIVGSIWRLKSYGFTSLTQTSEHRGFFCI